ncbi:Superfamily II DNA or RNA helicase, SNF2 family [Tessaracoccus bendigoensis DSM 12906]|uniref:Superfamily II DNA or RNA helicase, SNF2 family n=1 Tax=Tessaracoccus bendigoensis DSM 12906 TaxID=1123357 RepID=A0A1M6M9Y6_9ACTN|nr:DEAD/DEAH box helicase [Tessaracoccus bendigoensis]SHJ80262.1 Superfamily II DNA or RNA helicase, SNF2 family [Tessaracoccus bendigoensis DSM 12906]
MRNQGAEWVLAFTVPELKRLFSASSYARGQEYQATGRVHDLITSPNSLSALVSGSGRNRYQVEIIRGVHWVEHYCSCPMGHSCKHVVATLLAARALLRNDTSPTVSWESRLGKLTGGTDSVVGGAKSLALEFSVGQPQYGAPVPRILLQPLREGVQKPWVKTGASWAEINQPWRSGDLNRAQRTGLVQLHNLAPVPDYSYGSPAVDLGSLGSPAWPLLRRVSSAGVAFLAGAGLSDVRMGDDAATVSLDLTRSPDGGITARPLVSVLGPVPQGQILLLGSPPHGVAHVSEGRLTLWPLTAPPPDGLDRLLLDGDHVDIPAADVDRFLTLYYPALARAGSVTTVDGTVEAPELLPPVLHLTLTHLPSHVAQLDWGFSYPSAAEDGAPTVVPLATVAGGPPRDIATEHRLCGDLLDLLATVAPNLIRRDPRPTLIPQLELTGMASASFLTEGIPRLREAGVTVLEIGEAVPYTEAAEAPVVNLTAEDSDDRDWFNLHIVVTIDGQQVPFEELFLALATGEDALLLDSGTWFRLDLPELQALRRLIEEARELTDGDPSGPLRIGPYQAGLWEELVEMGVVARQSSRWRDAVQRLLPDEDRAEATPPTGLRAELRPYQVRGYQWLATLWEVGLGGVLADDMGLGKTLQTLALLERARESGELDGRPVLVVAPASVVGTWVEEAARFAPALTVVPITATVKKRGQDLPHSIEGAHVVVTSYTLLRLEDADYRALPWSGLILDEAQFVKNHRSRTYQAARRLGAPFTLAVTGTPLENSLMDLWSMLSLSAPGLFPRPTHFIERFRKPIENDRDLIALDTLRRRIRPFVLRRTKREVVQELPDKIEQVQKVELTPVHRRVYDRYLQRERQRVLGMLDDMDRNRVAIFRALTMLRQLALDPVLVDAKYATSTPSAKVSTLVEQVVELAAEGHRALVFSSFTGYLKLVREALDEAGVSYVYLDGRTMNRPARIAQFREGDDPVFLISLKAGGFGLTLTEADYVFVLDPWWNPAAENQAIDRTHRIGQTRSVNVYRMVSTDTIEEKVVALQERKRDLFSSVVDSGTFSSGAITAADIRALFDQ